MTRMEMVVERLEELGAHEVGHPGGTLLRHLRGAHDALERLAAPDSHRLAALCHAVYGTDGFDRPLFDPADRRPLRDLIGDEAERLVWLYSRSDQDRFTRTAADDHPVVPDRHDDSQVRLTDDEFAGLLAMWLGNELDLLEHADPSWALDGGVHVWAMLDRNRDLLPGGGAGALTRAVATARSKTPGPAGPTDEP